MESNKRNLSSKVYATDIKDFLSPSSTTFFDSSSPDIVEIVQDFEGRIAESEFVPVIETSEPIILDLGCGDGVPHFFKMMDYFGDNFTYIGIDNQVTSENWKWLEFLKKRHNNFIFIPADLQDPKFFESFKEANIIADIVLVENLAVGPSNNKETDALLKYVLNTFIPPILSPQGMIHLEAASYHQEDVIKKLLIDKQKDGWEFEEVDESNFIAVKDPSLLLKLKTELKK